MNNYGFVIAVLLASSVGAWGCATHQRICNDIGLGELDCCLADSSKTPAMIYHHCENGAEDCAARFKAREYLDDDRIEIAAHLFADAYSPVHWHKFNGVSCHSEFETAVDKAINNPDFNVSVNCEKLDGTQFAFYMDKYYLETVERGVQRDFGYINMTPTLAPPIPELPKQEGWWEMLIRYLGELIKGAAGLVDDGVQQILQGRRL
jgi:hypothetical protein